MWKVDLISEFITFKSGSFQVILKSHIEKKDQSISNKTNYQH